MSFVERCRQRHLGSEGGDEGFTLIELLVVLLIIGILLAIAIPTFLSVTKGANNTAAQSNLQNALTGAKTYYTDSNQTYAGLTTPTAQTSDIQQIGTGLSFPATMAAASSGPHVISWNISGTPNGQVLQLAAYASGSNDCWVLVDVTGTQTSTTDGFTGSTATGDYYGVVKGGLASACIATVSVPTANQSTTGFPSG
jgi:type IV pilus assembly protein PilA